MANAVLAHYSGNMWVRMRMTNALLEQFSEKLRENFVWICKLCVTENFSRVLVHKELLYLNAI